MISLDTSKMKLVKLKDIDSSFQLIYWDELLYGRKIPPASSFVALVRLLLVFNLIRMQSRATLMRHSLAQETEFYTH